MLLVAVALAVAAVLLAIGSAPPERLTLATTFADGTARGVLHVHSTRSDGIATPEAIAHAAASAGLSFVVLTDHGDATRKPDPPAYVDGVLVIDAVEISTTGGHYIAIDMPAAPYPLGGEPRDVVEDVARLGGFGIVAHPASPKPALAWHDWDAPFNGMELVNLDTAWRRRVAEKGISARLQLIGATLGSFIRPTETIAAMAGPGEASERWAHAAAVRRVVIAAGTDAHGGLTVGDRASGEGGVLPLPLPGYAAAFRAMSVHAGISAPFSGHAAVDAQVLFEALRTGRLYVSLDGLAGPAAFTFSASNAIGDAGAGDQLLPGGPTTLHVRSNAPSSFRTWIWRNDERLGEPHNEQDFTVDVDGEPAFYRVVIEAPRGDGSFVPWLLSNPIYVRNESTPAPAQVAVPAVEDAFPIFGTVADAPSWHVETDATSLAAVDPADTPTGAELLFRWGLPGGPPDQHYAALVGAWPSTAAGADELAFEARSERPARIFVELRSYRPAPDAPRWERSIYLDSEWKTYRLPFGEFRQAASGPVSPGGGLTDVLFVVNTLNTSMGTSGRLWFRNVRAERTAQP